MPAREPKDVLRDLHAVNEGEPHLVVRLRLGWQAKQAPQPPWDLQPTEVDLLQLVESLRVLGLPLESPAEKHRIVPAGAPRFEEGPLPDRLDRPAGQRCADPQNPYGGSGADHREDRCQATQRDRDPRRMSAGYRGSDDCRTRKHPSERGVPLEGAAPGHVVLAQKHRPRPAG